ncbi:glycosyltransferase family 4 protein [Halostella salina]|uniref:glycosyltransferase family 4 protein n=1 Tax=Halostella salina TaxID=1547897 RepID=UPI000EF77F87|nr:glycosyltransferase family 4 protein [Halostella salina]
MAPSVQGSAPRVCIVTTAHHTTDSRVVHREAISLERAGYDVTYYTPFADDCPVDAVTYADHASGSIPSIRERLFFVVKLMHMLWGTDYDVYHLHSVELLPLGGLLGAVSDGCVVYDVHENVEDALTHKEFLPDPVNSHFATVASAVELTLTRLLDAVIVASPDLLERFDSNDEVTVVTNYPRRGLAEGTSMKGRHEDNGEPTQFVYCGHLAEYRGILTLIDAVDRLPDRYDVSLVLGGEYASDGIRERIQRRAAETDRVRLVGWLPTFDDMIELFRRSDVGLMCFHPDPNKTDAVHRSNKLFQYMATALPVIVSDVGEWEQFVADIGFGVAVDPHDPEAIATAMAELADDPDRRAELGRNGHEAALDRYNWESQCETLLALYRRLAPGSDRQE